MIVFGVGNHYILIIIIKNRPQYFFFAKSQNYYNIYIYFFLNNQFLLQLLLRLFEKISILFHIIHVKKVLQHQLFSLGFHQCSLLKCQIYTNLKKLEYLQTYLSLLLYRGHQKSLSKQVVENTFSAVQFLFKYANPFLERLQMFGT